MFFSSHPWSVRWSPNTSPKISLSGKPSTSCPTIWQQGRVAEVRLPIVRGQLHCHSVWGITSRGRSLQQAQGSRLEDDHHTQTGAFLSTHSLMPCWAETISITLLFSTHRFPHGRHACCCSCRCCCSCCCCFCWQTTTTAKITPSLQLGCFVALLNVRCLIPLH